MIQAMSGLMSVTGTEKPTKVGVAVSDLITGLYAATGILAALTRARETGQGEWVDVSLLDSQLAALANQGMNYLVTGESPGLAGNAHPNIVPYQVFESADDPFVVAVGNDRQFTLLCKAIGLDDLALDARFASNAARVQNRDILVPILAGVLRRHPATHWLDCFERHGIPAAPVNTIAKAFGDPHVRERQNVMTLERDGLGSVPGVRSPVRLKNNVPDEVNAPPELGDSTARVLREIGFSDADIQTLLEGGIAGGPA